LERPTEVQQFPEFRAGRQKSSGSLNEVDTFKVKSQMIYFQKGNSKLFDNENE
jgi:hypothetical protein